MMIGISNSPGNYDGALIATVDESGNLAAEYTLSEQGVHDLLQSGLIAVVPGTDPAFEDNHDFGNLYVRDGTWSKKRNMQYVIHALGACIHDNGELYVAVGAHTGDDVTFEGRIFRSADQGDTWSSVYIAPYRCYDIISFSGRLYTSVYTGALLQLFVSEDDGDTWTVVPEASGLDTRPENNPRMVLWNGLLVAVNRGGGLFSIDSAGTLTVHSTPAQPLGVTGVFNSIAAHSSGLYILTGITSGKVYHTTDLLTWNYHCLIENPCVSIATWDSNGIVVGEKGIDARLLLVPFAEA